MRIISEQGLIKLALWGSLFIWMSCSSSDDPGPLDCNASNVELSFTSTDPTSCTANDGTIKAIAAGGEGPFQYALDAKAYASVADFTGLGAGIYQVRLKDKNGCERSTSVNLKPVGSTLAAIVTVIANSGCNTNNGAISISALGGTEPYSYSINDGVASSENSHGSLAAGNYTVKVTDNLGCAITQTVKVLSGIRLSVEIKAIIDASCAVTGCHISGGAAVSFTTLANIQSSASQIKSKTASGEMPKGGAKLSQDKLNAIACWVDDGAPNN